MNRLHTQAPLFVFIENSDLGPWTFKILVKRVLDAFPERRKGKARPILKIYTDREQSKPTLSFLEHYAGSCINCDQCF